MALKVFEIFSAVSGMNGERRVAICFIASASSYKTFLSFVSHGFLVWIYSLQVSMNAKISFRALSSSKLSMCFSICFWFSFFSSVFGVFVIPYFSTRADVRETRFPSLFASSSLCLWIRACVEKSPSSPVEKGNCRRQKYRTESAPYFSARVIGEIALPRDFEIFFPLKDRKPWLNVVFGSSYPADFSIAGQYTVWNHVLSFPNRWTVGLPQNFSLPFSWVAV